MKKIISGLMLVFAALSLVSCVEMSSQTKLEFTKLPEAVLEANETLDTEAILIKIDGQEVTLAAAERMGAVVEGADETEAGYHTLLVTYKDVTIAFTYLINEKLPEVVDTTLDPSVDGVYQITSAAELRGFAQLVNEGNETYTKAKVALAADIDLAGYPWTPIGEGSRKDGSLDPQYTFQGEFDGGNHIIKNMSDAGYVPGKPGTYLNSSKNTIDGYAYGLFGVISENATIKNVKLENVKINGTATLNGKPYYADSVAGIVGYNNGGTLTIINCHVDGEIKGFDAVAGIVGRIYNYTGNLISISNCSNAADLLCTRTKDGKAAGMVGFAGANVVFSISECSNSGSRSVPVHEGTPHLNGSIYNRKWSSVLTYNGTEMVNASVDGTPDTTNESDIPLDK